MYYKILLICGCYVLMYCIWNASYVLVILRRSQYVRLYSFEL
jgi:hypothetical protein